MRHREFPSQLLDGIQKGDIQLGLVQEMPNGYLVGYQIHQPELYPVAFQNVGVNYLTRSPAQDAVVARPPTPQRSTKVDRDLLRMTFNDCPRLDPFCDIHFEVRREDSFLSVRLYGDVISQTSPWVSPSWIQNVKQPYLKIQCTPDSVPTKIEIASEVGSTRDSIQLREVRGRVLGPVERHITNPCDTNIFNVETGYESSVVTVSRKEFNLPGRSLTERSF